MVLTCILMTAHPEAFAASLALSGIALAPFGAGVPVNRNEAPPNRLPLRLR